jgi:hypothetical protein
MQVTANGTVSGIQSGDAITLLEIVWKTGGETEAQAMAAGRGVAFTTAADSTALDAILAAAGISSHANVAKTYNASANISAFQGGGQLISSANIISGTTYIPAVRVTESRGGSGSYAGAWTSGASTAATTTTTTTGDPSVGLLNFETTGLTPSTRTGAYVNNNAAYMSRVTTGGPGPHSGSYFMQNTVVTSAPFGELVRNITLPASGSVSFTRYFSASSIANVSGGAQVCLFSLGTNNTPSAWILDVNFYQNAIGTTKVAYGGSFGSDSTIAYDLVANTWYKLVVTLNCTNNTYSIYLYDTTGATLLGSSVGITPNSNFSGLSTPYIYVGRASTTGGATVYFDDFNDGV